MRAAAGRLLGWSCTALALASGATQAQQADAEDNGTDPTRLSSNASVNYERLELRSGDSTDTFKFTYAVPVGAKGDYALRFRAPVARNPVAGNGDFGLGDVSIALTHVFGLTREQGFVVTGELVFDSASRPELGTGRHVLKGNFVWARFLAGGNIFAPALVHSVSVGGDSSRAKVNSTTLDFYYVPKLPDPKMFMTLDPALTFDWENDKQFASLAVTLGYALGPAFGGRSQISVKPSVQAGGDRPAKWGIELGYKVIGL